MDKIIAKRYKITKDIGHGGMADVYLAIDTLLNREVAIKILRGELCSDPISLLRFKREAQASCALIHPNIVEIYDVGEDQGHHYIVMEHIVGHTLKQLISKRGALLKEEAIDIMKQLISATIEAHNKGIIHRDIKPQNVIVKDDGTIKMLDFGIALAHDAMQLTHSDSVLGSVHYLAPELARGENATFQSDIYSLGIVFYELLSGDVPFKGETPVQIALKHMRDEIPSIKEMIPTLPQSLENIILRATVKRKELRYPSANEMLKEVQSALLPSNLNVDKIIFDYHDDANGGTKPMSKIDKKINSKKDLKDKEPKSVAAYFIWIILSIIGVFAVVVILFLTSNFSDDDVVLTPNCVGLSIEQCQQVLEDTSITLDTSRTSFEMTDDIAEGIIVNTYPNYNEEVELGTTMTLIVSAGTWSVMEDYVGTNINEAKNEIKEKFDNVRVNVVEEDSPGSTPGIVLRQELLAPNEKFASNVQVDLNLIIAAYPNFLLPTQLNQMDIDEAKNLIESFGGKVMFQNLAIPDGENEVQLGVVVKTSPSIGSWYTQEEDNYVTIFYY